MVTVTYAVKPSIPIMMVQDSDVITTGSDNNLLTRTVSNDVKLRSRSLA